MSMANNKGEEDPPPHESFQSALLTYYQHTPAPGGNAENDATKEEKVLPIEKEGR